MQVTEMTMHAVVCPLLRKRLLKNIAFGTMCKHVYVYIAVTQVKKNTEKESN